LYVAQGFETTEALCKGLTEDGFIVKLVHTATNAEFELSAGRLCPSEGALAREDPSQGIRPGLNIMDAFAMALRPLQFRGKERLANAIIPRTGQRSASIFGSRFSLDLSDFIQRHMYAGSYERLESQVVRRLLRRGMTFVDVGANVGYYTAMAAESVGPEGQVLAFEPSQYAFSRLRRMVQGNRLNWVTVFQCGLADQPGQTTLYGGAEDDLLNNHTATMVPHDNSYRRVVEVDTLDRFAERLNIEHIDLVKIDVDGFEMLVLRGASRLIGESRIANIILECNEHWFQQMNISTAEIVEHLKASGFSKVSRIGRSDNHLFTYNRPASLQSRRFMQ
jgi:FkbM family methyltransferase